MRTTAILAAMLVGLLGVTSLASPEPIRAQDSGEWEVRTDPFADLWFHGLATVGFHGFGAVPMYAPEYVDAGEDRASLLTALRSDLAFEVLHFLPLFMIDAPVGMALDALSDLQAHDDHGEPAIEAGAHRLAAVLDRPEQRAILSRFVDRLRTMRGDVEPVSAEEYRAVRDTWLALVAEPSFAHVLAENRVTVGRVVLTRALGVEGRMLHLDGEALVMVGVRPDEPAGSTVGALIRELCYPAVRRAVAPYETGFADRVTLSDVSDLLATRCGARVVAHVRPEWLDDYTARFGARGVGADFLSAAGVAPDVAVLERTLDQALGHELNLDRGSAAVPSAPAGRER